MGWKSLVDRHPSMATWPETHRFVVHKFTIQDIWMIANYGGQTIIDPDTYYNASNDNLPQAPLNTKNNNHVEITKLHKCIPQPNWDERAKRARWIVMHSLYTTGENLLSRLSTIRFPLVPL